ncbi:hypothetical protein Golomagni_01095 [Golovinomyces magnicellulatus]|nr:hypothetical protein Golomagni_01095 [Golovinomyces magnicellulatus]
MRDMKTGEEPTVQVAESANTDGSKVGFRKVAIKELARIATKELSDTIRFESDDAPTIIKTATH